VMFADPSGHMPKWLGEALGYGLGSAAVIGGLAGFAFTGGQSSLLIVAGVASMASGGLGIASQALSDTGNDKAAFYTGIASMVVGTAAMGAAIFDLYAVGQLPLMAIVAPFVGTGLSIAGIVDPKHADIYMYASLGLMVFDTVGTKVDMVRHVNNTYNKNFVRTWNDLGRYRSMKSIAEIFYNRTEVDLNCQIWSTIQPIIKDGRFPDKLTTGFFFKKTKGGLLAYRDQEGITVGYRDQKTYPAFSERPIHILGEDNYEYLMDNLNKESFVLTSEEHIQYYSKDGTTSNWTGQGGAVQEDSYQALSKLVYQELQITV